MSRHNKRSEVRSETLLHRLYRNVLEVLLLLFLIVTGAELLLEKAEPVVRRWHDITAPANKDHAPPPKEQRTGEPTISHFGPTRKPNRKASFNPCGYVSHSQGSPCSLLRPLAYNGPFKSSRTRMVIPSFRATERDSRRTRRRTASTGLSARPKFSFRISLPARITAARSSAWERWRSVIAISD